MTPRHLLAFFDSRARRTWAKHFFDFDITAFERLLTTKDESFWDRLGEQRALALFRAAAKDVPAYRDFLRDHRVKSASIRTIQDFAAVPTTDKKNYIEKYPLEQRCWDGKLSGNSIVAMSSGTSGEPTFWPRGGYAEFEAAIIHELAYRSLFAIHKKRTLLIIGFPMGVYVSGVATLLPSWLVTQRGYDLTVVTTGNNKKEMLRIAQHLRKPFEQVVLVGHPFFIKDVVETGASEGINWASVPVSMLYCSEGFNEGWRDHVSSVAGIPKSQIRAFNTYGSSETLLVGHETIASVALRRTMTDPLVPNVFQYNPLFRYIEASGRALNFTSDNGIPLIKYDLGDGGSILPFTETTARVPKKALRGAWKLPFVTLDGRRDQTIIFYAANIYPEHIHSALNDPKFLGKITGKFALRKDYLKNKDQFLEMNIELRPGVKPTATFANTIGKHVVSQLLNVNMEYNFLWNNLDKDIRPRIVLRPYQDVVHFRPGLKPKYIIKETP